VCYKGIATGRQPEFLPRLMLNLRKCAVQWLDQIVIRLAANRMPPSRGLEPHLDEAMELIGSAGMFPGRVEAANLELMPEVTPNGVMPFRFVSSVRTPFSRNNTAHGVLQLAHAEGWNRPAVILLHGWNDSLSYNIRLPQMARLLAGLGINSARLTLPYHFARQPESGMPVRNFLSEDLLRTAEATQQAVADIRALAGWLRKQGSPEVGVWGVSLGGWLGGLALCTDPGIDFGVFVAPAARMGQLLREIEFARPLRDALQGRNIDLTGLNLASKRPTQDQQGRILLVKSEYDRFIAPDSIEELWESWGQPEIWRLPHGHISVLCSPRMFRRSVEWIKTRGIRAPIPPISGSCGPRQTR
jgi:dienelactone hydrolase